MIAYGKNIIVQDEEAKERVTATGLVLQAELPANSNIVRGAVVSVGEDVEIVQEGDIVLYRLSQYNKFIHEDEKYVVIDKSDIVAIIQESNE